MQTHGQPFGSEFIMDRLHVRNLWGELNRTVLGLIHFKFQTYQCCEHRAEGLWRLREEGGRMEAVSRQRRPAGLMWGPQAEKWRELGRCTPQIPDGMQVERA